MISLEKVRRSTEEQKEFGKAVRKAGRAPVVRCMAAQTPAQGGRLAVCVHRAKDGTYSMGLYLVDTLCKGVVKCAAALGLDEGAYLEESAALEEAYGLREATLEEVRYLVYGSVAWASKAGIAPGGDFLTCKGLLPAPEEDEEGSYILEPAGGTVFGRDGLHHLVASDRMELSRYLPSMKLHLGDRFGYEVADGE